MMTALLADLVLLVHLAWIAFLVGGLALAWRWRALAWPHLAGLALLLALNLGGWYCPLTHLEAWLRGLGGAAPALGQSRSFLSLLVERLVYPAWPEAWLRLAGGLWAATNLAGHVWLWRRRRAARGAEGDD